jgi:glycosyltransferase involved in cell wall biosynthesis
MKIAIFGSRGYPNYYGGFETLVRNLAPYLVESGHDVTVYGRAWGWRAKSSTVNGVHVRDTVGLDKKATSTLSFGLTGSIDMARGKPPFDAALVLNVANGHFLKYLKRHGIPTCVNVDGLEWTRDKWGSVAKFVFFRGARHTAEHASEIIIDSKALEDTWKEMFGRSGTFIPYGADVSIGVGSELVVEQGLPTSGYLLVVSRIVPENNIDLFLDAYELLEEQVPLVVVGSSNYEHATLARLRRLSAKKRIHWLGHVSDQDLLLQLWANCSVYWHGHSVGGTNPALLQAMGAGAATLAYDTPYNREVLGDSSQLIPADPKALAERLTQLLAAPELRTSIAARQQEIIRSDYRWDDVCASYERVLRSIA